MPTSNNTQKDSPKIHLTLEDALELLGWTEIPGIEDLDNPDPVLKGIFLRTLESHLRKKGLDWVKTHKNQIMWEWEALLVVY
ncbi:MAG: hypothetical protein LBJ61_08485 [Deltaproteobacteria bacterium]|jgi:hypothetical protein|nr:hypothetical protein [Deltaproteobacteria bacterium]